MAQPLLPPMPKAKKPAVNEEQSSVRSPLGEDGHTFRGSAGFERMRVVFLEINHTTGGFPAVSRGREGLVESIL